MSENKERTIHSIAFMTITFTLQSAMSIGTGEKQSIVCDSEGNPYIPATSIAGVLRHAMPKETAEKLFGWVSLERNNQEKAKPTRINIGNAEVSGEYSLVYREGVQLDKFRTAADGRKYTLLAVDRGARFVSHLELEFESPEQETELMAALSDVLARMHKGEITLGHKSTRGFGKVKLECTYKCYSGENLLDSIDHEAGKDEKPFVFEEQERAEKPLILIERNITLRDSLCIREYTLEPPADRGSDSAPSYVQMMSGGKPIIPGMSWAGVFRHGAERVLCNLGLDEKISKECVNELFGYVVEGKKETDEKKSVKSRIRFEDTIFGTYQELIGRRTAINRFSGGAASKALYTEGTIVPKEKDTCNGTLRIFIEKNPACDGWGEDLIWLLLRELHEGRLHVGGNGSIGRGMFKVEGEIKPDDYKYKALAEMIRKKKGGANQNV